MPSSEIQWRATDPAFVAESLQHLGVQIGVDQSLLQKTVDEYNRFCDKGHDDLFAKDSKYTSGR